MAIPPARWTGFSATYVALPPAPTGVGGGTDDGEECVNTEADLSGHFDERERRTERKRRATESLQSLPTQLRDYFTTISIDRVLGIPGPGVAPTITACIGPCVDQYLSPTMFTDILNLRTVSRAWRGMVEPRKGAFESFSALIVQQLDGLLENRHTVCTT